MKSIEILLLLASLMVVVDTHFPLYHSNDRYGLNATFDCLYAYSRSFSKGIVMLYDSNYNLVPYCRRLDENDNEEEKNSLMISSENILNNITFAELYRQGITSTQLLNWAAPIDVAERYEENGENSTEIFYNCSSPWFGPTCQYRFDINILSSFNNIGQFIFSLMNNVSFDKNAIIGTCYPFLTGCYRGPLPVCLDWREICDGVIDCMNGEDEELCEIFELNECIDNEFRCHFGGQCIPLAFVGDGKISTDCLDGTDEVDLERYHRASIDEKCSRNPTFQCEELSGRRSLIYLCKSARGLIFITGDEHPNRRRCPYDRNTLMFNKMFTSLDHILDLHCRRALHYLLRLTYGDPFIYEGFNDTIYESSINSCSLKWLLLPKYPILFGFFQLVYLTNRSLDDFKKSMMPNFICFNASRCRTLLISCSGDIDIHNGLTCCKSTTLTNKTFLLRDDWNDIFMDLARRCSAIGKVETCSHSSLFHCSSSSKCISKYRLVDGYDDCYYKEDELVSGCQLNDSNRFICQSNPKKCLSMIAVNDGKNDCKNGEDEWTEYSQNILINKAPIGVFCDDKNDLLSTDMLNDTDETNCEWWPCNNPYFRCDNYWHCLNGEDEINCPDIKCSLNQHKCSVLLGTEYRCIPVVNLMEKYSNCEWLSIHREIYFTNETFNDSMNYFLWNETKCITFDKICSDQLLSSIADEDICLVQPKLRLFSSMTAILMHSTNILCDLMPTSYLRRERKLFLTTSRLSYLPSISPIISVRQIIQDEMKIPINTNISNKSLYCHRGISILYKNNQTNKCLCPPNYFGNQCQWQNQRISLTIQLNYRSITNIISIFQLIIMIINEKGEIEPYHEQLTYVPRRDCNTKFNIYLLYQNRPKNLSLNNSIRIDIFNKITLKYYGSWHLSIPFQFLPVNRISSQLVIPSNIEQIEFLCPLNCGNHGKCNRYINKNVTYFCQCDEGYIGSECHIKVNCSCSFDSYCFSSSICICPIHKFGSKCYLKHSNCQLLNSSCENNGLCIPNDDRININGFICLCSEGFNGIRCENQIENQINIEFDEEMIRDISIVYIHFITSFQNSEHQHITILKKIKYGINEIKIYATQPYHILFIELTKRNYYLTVIREKFIQTENVQIKLKSNQRCVYIDEIINSTFKSYSYLHRIKYYPFLCRQNKQLKCFYDENYMCLCDLDRFSNCFIFNHSKIYDCQDYNDCQNDGQCFPNNVTCPSRTICICSDCFYGNKCQFTTKGFVLSLDYILGYHIKPNISLNQQPSIIHVSIGITTIMFLVGLIGGILSILTFRMKKTRDVGCGFYLLISSWISIGLIILLLFKFWQLVLSQMIILTNRSFINVNCILLDFMIRILLAIHDWLGGCVSIERVFAVIKGVKFNKTKSKRMAKWITIIIIILTISSHIHDPLNRHLIDDIDVDEKRIWCLVKYSSSINIFNSFITIIHFIIPFLINLSSIIFIIISVARSRFSIQPRLSYKEHLRLQLKQHKHRLIASIILVLLALPRLIISFISGCMKTPNNSWVFLFAYFISFLPSMATFIVYVLPSKMYKDEFNTVVDRTIRRIRNIV